MSQHPFDFMCDGMPVGYFAAEQIPTSPGRHRFVAYRGEGHYTMQTRLRTDGAARCWYDAGERRVSFTVSGSPEHGVIDIRDFDSAPRE